MPTFFSFSFPYGGSQVKQTLGLLKIGLEDMTQVWRAFAANIRRSERLTFLRQQDPVSGATWTPLSPDYARRKGMSGVGFRRGGRVVPFGSAKAVASSYRGVLIRSGALYRAASQPGAPGQIIVTQPRQMTFGVDLGQIYPAVFQRTVRLRKDGKPIGRRWLGLRLPDDLLALKSQIVARIRTLAGQKVAVGPASRGQ